MGYVPSGVPVPGPSRTCLGGGFRVVRPTRVTGTVTDLGVSSVTRVKDGDGVFRAGEGERGPGEAVRGVWGRGVSGRGAGVEVHVSFRVGTRVQVESRGETD